MGKIFDIFVNLLGSMMNLIYSICNNYGVTIIIFTIISKVILFPINLMIQKNSIKMVKMKPKIEELKIKYSRDKDAFMDAKIELFEQEKYHPTLGVIPLLLQIPIILGLIQVISNPNSYIKNLLNVNFLNINLSVIPSFNNFLIIPILAAISTILLCLFQNRINVLQREESLFSKLLSGGITVIITVYFVFVVPIGVAIYWILGNLLSIIQMYILNWIYPPEKYVDYEWLEKVKKQKKERKEKDKISKKKSKYYYKKFFEEENINNMKIMFYSEQSGFFKYYKGMIEHIIENSDIIIHYVTSDINDKIFEQNNSRIIPYYIDKNKLIPLFMKLECDVVVMTTPDLQNLYLKRSIVKKDIEYIFTDHGIGSPNMTYKQGALDNYDTIFVRNFKQEQEVIALEELRGTKKKKIVQTGYTLIEEMIDEYEKNKKENKVKTIVIAPSWQEDNIMECCIDKIIDPLLNSEYKIIVRPHPQYIKLFPEKIKEFEEKYNKIIGNKLEFEKDFSSNSTVYNADLLITDWSGIGYEFSFSTTKPCLFINTKMKVLNPNYKDISIVPMDIEVREQIGKCIEKEELGEIKKYIDELIYNQNEYMENNKKLRNKYIFNLGKAKEIEGNYIIERIKGDDKK